MWWELLLSALGITIVVVCGFFVYAMHQEIKYGLYIVCPYCGMEILADQFYTHERECNA